MECESGDSGEWDKEEFSGMKRNVGGGSAHGSVVYGEWLRKKGEVGESAMHVSPDKLSVFTGESILLFLEFISRYDRDTQRGRRRDESSSPRVWKTPLSSIVGNVRVY